MVTRIDTFRGYESGHAAAKAPEMNISQGEDANKQLRGAIEKNIIDRGVKLKDAKISEDRLTSEVQSLNERIGKTNNESAIKALRGRLEVVSLDLENVKQERIALDKDQAFSCVDMLNQKGVSSAEFKNNLEKLKKLKFYQEFHTEHAQKQEKLKNSRANLEEAVDGIQKRIDSAKSKGGVKSQGILEKLLKEKAGELLDIKSENEEMAKGYKESMITDRGYFSEADAVKLARLKISEPLNSSEKDELEARYEQASRECFEDYKELRALKKEVDW